MHQVEIDRRCWLACCRNLAIPARSLRRARRSRALPVLVVRAGLRRRRALRSGRHVVRTAGTVTPVTCGACEWGPMFYAAVIPVTAFQSTSVSYAIPYRPALAGATFEAQWAMLDFLSSPCIRAESGNFGALTAHGWSVVAAGRRSPLVSTSEKLVWCRRGRTWVGFSRPCRRGVCCRRRVAVARARNVTYTPVPVRKP